MNEVLNRIEKLERKNKVYRLATLTLALLCAGVFMLGAATDTDGETIRAKTIALLDEDGEVAIEIDAEMIFDIIEQSKRDNVVLVQEPNRPTLHLRKNLNGSVGIGIVEEQPRRTRPDLPFEPFVTPAK